MTILVSSYSIAGLALSIIGLLVAIVLVNHLPEVAFVAIAVPISIVIIKFLYFIYFIYSLFNFSY
ncbi:hypothetical protein MKY84_05360 [Chryseomicrobium sp. FSL W7-1435]|uniref:hypothetical protein n=1 Tax=Chryseomicrobium sp. FSL W7-1435 TaxID=2921704 RepID=UPI00315AB36C